MGEEQKCTQQGRLATLEAESKSIYKRIDNLEKVNDTILELTRSITKLAENMRETKEDVKSIKSDISRLKETPVTEAQYYKRMVIGLIIGGAMGYILNSLW